MVEGTSKHLSFNLELSLKVLLFRSTSLRAAGSRPKNELLRFMPIWLKLSMLRTTSSNFQTSMRMCLALQRVSGSAPSSLSSTSRPGRMKSGSLSTVTKWLKPSSSASEKSWVRVAIFSVCRLRHSPTTSQPTKICRGRSVRCQTSSF